MALARSFSNWLFLAAGAALVFVALAANNGAGAQQARAAINGWSLCNETSYVLEAATGRPDGRSIQVQGWTRLRPGECRLAVGAGR